MLTTLSTGTRRKTKDQYDYIFLYRRYSIEAIGFFYFFIFFFTSAHNVAVFSRRFKQHDVMMPCRDNVDHYFDVLINILPVTRVANTRVILSLWVVGTIYYYYYINFVSCYYFLIFFIENAVNIVSMKNTNGFFFNFETLFAFYLHGIIKKKHKRYYVTKNSLFRLFLDIFL